MALSFTLDKPTYEPGDLITATLAAETDEELTALTGEPFEVSLKFGTMELNASGTVSTPLTDISDTANHDWSAPMRDGERVTWTATA